MKITVGLLTGYNGKDFYGSTYNQDLKTIELRIVKALLKVKAIKEQNALNATKIGMSRCSRTDKGVHAVMALFTCRIECDITEELIKSLKEILIVDSIYLYKIIRLSKGFNPQSKCGGRTYSYFIPTFIFSKNFEFDFRLDQVAHKLFKEICSKYIGTKNYHNFTQLSNTKGIQRYIKNIDVSEPFMYDDIEYIKITLSGNSFLLHQIRKMMGFAIILVKFRADDYETVFNLAFEEDTINIAKAPSQYLMLESQDFSFYNTKPIYDSITYDASEMEKVKETLIYPTIFQRENAEIFQNWFDIFEKHNYNFTYLNK